MTISKIQVGSTEHDIIATGLTDDSSEKIKLNGIEEGAEKNVVTSIYTAGAGNANQVGFSNAEGNTWLAPKLDPTTQLIHHALLPAATSSALGGVKVGYTRSTPADDGTYAVELNDNNQMYVTHPTSTGHKHIPAGGVSGQILRWSADGTAVWGADNNTTYSAGTGISLSGTTFSNSGVRSIATGSSNGTISVNTNGTSADVAVKGLGSAAYTASTAYAAAGHTHNYAGSSSAGGAATSANKVNTNLAIKLNSGTTEGTNLFTFNGSTAKTVNITPSAIGAAASSHNHDGSYLKQYGLNGCNVDSTSGCWTVDISDSSHGTVPTTWVNVTQTTSGHFLTQIAKKCDNSTATDSSRNQSVWVRDKYVGGGWSSWKRIDITNQLYNFTANVPVVETYSANSYYSFNPVTDRGDVYLGYSSAKWAKIYAATSAITTSDEREKSNIMAIADYPATYSRDGSGNVFEKLFNKLTPKTFTLNAEDTDELHIGFVAQDIENSMEELGLSASDLGFIIHDYWTDDETGEEKDSYGLRYEEFMALNTYMIQKQQTTIEEQQVQIADLEERIAQLEELVNNN